MSRGWHGDSTRHSLASRGIRTNYEFESMYANGLFDKAKDKVKAGATQIYGETKSFFKSFKKDASEKYGDVKKSVDKTKKVGKSIGSLALDFGKEFVQMGKEMVNSASTLIDIPEEEGGLSEATKTRLRNESKRIENDIKSVEQIIRERKKIINEMERQDQKDFQEWYKNEKEVYDTMRDSIKTSGFDDNERSYQLRNLEIEFRSNIQYNKNIINETKARNNADIVYLRKLIEDLKRLRREVDGRVASGY